MKELEFEPWLIWLQRDLALVLCGIQYIQVLGDAYSGTRLQGASNLEMMFPPTVPVILNVLWMMPSSSCATFNLLFSPDSRTIENLEENGLPALVSLQGNN